MHSESSPKIIHIFFFSGGLPGSPRHVLRTPQDSFTNSFRYSTGSFMFLKFLQGFFWILHRDCFETSLAEKPGVRLYQKLFKEILPEKFYWSSLRYSSRNTSRDSLTETSKCSFDNTRILSEILARVSFTCLPRTSSKNCVRSSSRNYSKCSSGNSFRYPLRSSPKNSSVISSRIPTRSLPRVTT